MFALDFHSTHDSAALELHQTAMSVAKDIKANYLSLFEVLLAIEKRQAYFDFEVPSLHLYCVELLELSKDTAKNLIVVVRKSLEVPELAAAVRSCRLTIPKARKICSVINTANHREWIELAIHCSCRVVEKAVAMANPKEVVAESVKYVSGEVLEFKTGVSEEWWELLTRTKDLASQRNRKAVSASEALFIAMTDYRKRYDPVEKAKRAEERAQRKLVSRDTSDVEFGSTQAEGAEQLKSESNAAKKGSPQAGADAKGEALERSRHRPAASEHSVNLRDQGQCIHTDKNGKRCTARRWLNKHHIVEFAEGGDHRPENLETLCWAHHKIKHLKEWKASRDAFPNLDH
jgi:hypothetical protein